MVVSSACGRRAQAWVLATALLLGCSGDAEREPLVIFAASSLTDAFEVLAREFEAAHPAIDVQPTFAGSQVLRLQIEQGAPAEVYASANWRHVEALREAGLVTEPRPFAAGGLALIVPDDSPIERFEHLDRAERIVVGAPSVPIGRYTRALLERAEATYGASFVDSVRAHVASEESNVRLVRAKVELGEADAAFVYRTDARGLRTVPIPPPLDLRARYAIAVTTGADHRNEAVAFVAFVRSAAGQAILRAHGFLPEDDR